MKKFKVLILAIALVTATTASAARPGDRDPFEPIMKKLVRVIRFIVSPHDGGIIPPHP